ncbi:hypothetical protein IE81DRAFT_190872 [Ceraceosorus guamensis]|uniref:Uncharacterized protein n=1 Tax=Ceraceosorus guamensis TaxID=1522189 RepID=A0A316W6M1_9BASI|nr:hypothetical protein IE81DRAFT_190872 [Ceraceosorus guamensis]PWN45432.1 hypothetical protein IE81DRAFT_190872 [Ceraceosorus guamensis]
MSVGGARFGARRAHTAEYESECLDSTSPIPHYRLHPSPHLDESRVPEQSKLKRRTNSSDERVILHHHLDAASTSPSSSEDEVVAEHSERRFAIQAHSRLCNQPANSPTSFLLIPYFTLHPSSRPALSDTKTSAPIAPHRSSLVELRAGFLVRSAARSSSCEYNVSSRPASRTSLKLKPIWTLKVQSLPVADVLKNDL